MLNFANLRKTGQGWEFENEEALEDFTWANLTQLLGLIPLKRQYMVKGQICDILAVDDNKRLVVLELKNIEDRYIVQQLTRYYDALLEEKPFNEVVDYSQSIRLIAIIPKIHRDNLTDRKYHHLSIQFLQFEFVNSGERLYLQLKDIDTEKLFHLETPLQEKDITEILSTPPKLLQKLLSSCNLEQIRVIIEIRNQILSFEQRMEEISIAGMIKYGNGKSKTSKFCAEFCSDSKGELFIFLWLPLKGLKSQKVCRARIWTDWNDKALIEGYVVEGIGSNISLSKKVILNRDKRLKKNSLGQVTYETERKDIVQYCKDINRIRGRIAKSQPVTHEEIKHIEAYIEEHDIVPYKSLKSLVDLALKKWLERL